MFKRSVFERNAHNDFILFENSAASVSFSKF